MEKFTLFDQGAFIGQYSTVNDIPFGVLSYQGYLHSRTTKNWYRRNITIVPEDEVPKEYKAWLLLLGGS
jgi:hypothetical protein